MKYKLGILTSLYDDYAVKLLQTIDKAIDDGMIDAEVPFVFCNRAPGFSKEVDFRIQQVKRLKYLNNLIFLSAKDFLPQLRSNAKHDPKLLERWRIEYDRQMLKLLRKADSYLNVGYMQIIGPEILRTIDIINLHPAIPAIGPVGMWPGVMKEQAQRPLPYLLKLKEVTKKDISKVMNISRNKAGGMLHIATEELDRGPVISWYEFALTSPKLNKLWLKAVRGYKDKEFNLTINALAEEIRAEQFKGEEPLILLTYKNLTRGDWEIRNKKLYIDGMECQGGYCLNREIGIFLRERGIESLIS